MNNQIKHYPEYQARIEAVLCKILSNGKPPSTKLNQAIAYSTLNAGKRLRPILVYLTGQCFEQTLDLLDYAAAAIECIHCYSLIHDDLPAMDDDDLRRGKPTCHIAFDEATAILAGDALQALAFECLSNYQNTHISPQSQLKAIHLLATASGRDGMVGGQSLDLEAEGRILTSNQLDQIHHLKTGALIKTSVLLGATLAECHDPRILKNLGEFGEQLGLAFQLQDDLLDTIGNPQQLGKNTGQDAKHGKATYTTLFGESITRNRIAMLTDNAIAALKALPIPTEPLESLCLHLMKREQ